MSKQELIDEINNLPSNFIRADIIAAIIKHLPDDCMVVPNLTPEDQDRAADQPPHDSVVVDMSDLLMLVELAEAMGHDTDNIHKAIAAQEQSDE